MQRRPFALERAYRNSFTAGLIDLSSSAAPAPTLSQLLRSQDLESLAGHSLGYETGGGSNELRAAVAAFYPGLSAENILITAGASEAIRAVAMALVSHGQPVLVQEPSYQVLSQSVIDAGGDVVSWRSQDGELQFDLRLRGQQDDAPQLAFLNSPHGPSGSLVRGIESFSGRVVVDEVYRPIHLNPGRLPSCVEYLPGSVAIGDLSKPLGLGGLRVGWVASTDTGLIQKCADSLDYLSCSISTLSAAVALQAIACFDDLLAPHLTLARRNLAHLARFVELHRDWLSWLPPQAGYTASLRLRGGVPPSDLFANLSAGGFLLLPGDVFGLPDCLRIGLGLPEETFLQALNLLGEEIRCLPCPYADLGEKPDVVLYTKLPRAGHGKSRLAAGVGVDRATALAHAFLQDSLELVEHESGRLFIAVAPSDAVPEFVSGLPEATVFRQGGDGMGARLASAFEGAFARGARHPVLIGSDTPTLPGHLLSVAALALQSHDVVLGPALDGGYYAIGLNRNVPSLFEGIDWSTERVLAQTVERAESAGLSVFFLPRWYDIDIDADLDLLRQDVRPGSATLAALRGLA